MNTQPIIEPVIDPKPGRSSGASTPHNKWLMIDLVLLVLIVSASFISYRLYTARQENNTIMQTPQKARACGGFTGETGPNACPSGYYCKYPEANSPDGQGICLRKSI